MQSVESGSLVNSHHLWAVFMLDSKATIEWELEGQNGGDFVLHTGVQFVCNRA